MPTAGGATPSGPACHSMIVVERQYEHIEGGLEEREAPKMRPKRLPHAR
jgi:hypothetical protein